MDLLGLKILVIYKLCLLSHSRVICLYFYFLSICFYRMIFSSLFRRDFHPTFVMFFNALRVENQRIFTFLRTRGEPEVERVLNLG